jgi:hypothetical protein
MEMDLPEDMADERRALLTETERAILLEEKDVSENHYYTVVSRVRKKINRLADDLEALEAHGDLLEELRDVVCTEGEDD